MPQLIRVAFALQVYASLFDQLYDRTSSAMCQVRAAAGAPYPRDLVYLIAFADGLAQAAAGPIDHADLVGDIPETVRYPVMLDPIRVSLRRLEPATLELHNILFGSRHLILSFGCGRTCVLNGPIGTIPELGRCNSPTMGCSGKCRSRSKPTGPVRLKLRSGQINSLSLGNARMSWVQLDHFFLRN
jgi:hypothetical protein